MPNSFVMPIRIAGGAVAQIYAPAGTIWRKPAALGGADPAGFVAFDGTEAAAGMYDVAMTEILGAGGEYLFTMPAGVPAGAHSYRGYAGGSLRTVVSSGDVGYWDGANFSIGFTQTDATALSGLFSGAAAASIPGQTGAVFDPVAAETAVYWSYVFTAPILLTGWTQVSFTVKADLNSDDDSAALLTVRLSNPAAVTDGILIHKGRAVPAGDPLRVQGALAVNQTDPSAILVATLLPAALTFPPNPDNVPYSFEWDWWDGAGIKRQIGRGDFTLARSVRRGVVAP